MELDLRPRFLPDRELTREWTQEGQILAAWILKGLPVPPIACFGRTASKTWNQWEAARLETIKEVFPGVSVASVSETLWTQLAGRADWPLQFRSEVPGTEQITEVTSPESILGALSKISSQIGSMTRDGKRPETTPVLVQPVLDVEPASRRLWRVSMSGVSLIISRETLFGRVLSRLGMGAQPVREFFRKQLPLESGLSGEHEKLALFSAEIAARKWFELTRSETDFEIEWAKDGEHFFLTRFRPVAPS